MIPSKSLVERRKSLFSPRVKREPGLEAYAAPLQAASPRLGQHITFEEYINIVVYDIIRLDLGHVHTLTGNVALVARRPL